MTDHPLLITVGRILNGNETIPNLLQYDSSIVINGSSNSYTLIDKKYVDDVAFGGVSAGTESAAGIWKGATPLQAASSTPNDGTYGYVDLAKHSTSTPTTSCDSSGTIGALCIPVAQNNGKLNNNFIDKSASSTWTGDNNFTASTTMASTSFSIIPTIPNASSTGSQVVGNWYFDLLHTVQAGNNILMATSSYEKIVTPTPTGATTTIKTINIGLIKGSLRVVYTYHVIGSAPQTCTYCIYKNDVYTGGACVKAQTTSGTYVNASAQDISGFNYYDNLSIGAASSSGGNMDCGLANFTIKADRGLTPTTDY